MIDLPPGTFQLPPGDDEQRYEMPYPLAEMDLARPEALSRRPAHAELPYMIETFDSLPPRLESYVLLHFLPRWSGSDDGSVRRKYDRADALTGLFPVDCRPSTHDELTFGSVSVAA